MSQVITGTAVMIRRGTTHPTLLGPACRPKAAATPGCRCSRGMKSRAPGSNGASVDRAQGVRSVPSARLKSSRFSARADLGVFSETQMDQSRVFAMT